MDGCRLRSGRLNITFQDLIDTLIPRRRHGPSFATTLLHSLGHITCSNSLCSAPASLQAIRTHWPAILYIKCGTNADSSNPLPRQNLVLSIRSSSDQSTPVQYQLVGCIRYHRKSEDDGTAARHFTMRIQRNGRVYAYDGMHRNGEMIDIGPSSLFVDEDLKAVGWVYSRTSTHFVRSICFVGTI